MFINNFDPVAIEIFSLEIRWYSLAYIFGILLGWYFAKKIFINNNIKNEFDDYITYVIIGLILGGRLGYILFYNLDYYLNNFFDIFKIWQGGMSFHGGVIGIIISSFLFVKKKNEDIFKYLDIDMMLSFEIDRNGLQIVLVPLFDILSIHDSPSGDDPRNNLYKNVSI